MQHESFSRNTRNQLRQVFRCAARIDDTTRASQAPHRFRGTQDTKTSLRHRQKIHVPHAQAGAIDKR